MSLLYRRPAFYCLCERVIGQRLAVPRLLWSSIFPNGTFTIRGCCNESDRRDLWSIVPNGAVTTTRLMQWIGPSRLVVNRSKWNCHNNAIVAMNRTVATCGQSFQMELLQQRDCCWIGPLRFEYDLGSPVVCGGVLTGLAPRGGGSKAINLTSDYWWIADTMAELAVTQVLHNSTEDQDPKVYFLQILEKLNLLSDAKSDSDRDRLTNWNNQIVIPMSYVLFAMVIFFFVLLFFIILFTVVLVYYSRK
ncbi:hypothetical protein J6590_061911 [Homalodisca vitripennis]|nr:hypothetical protein J6590_061911 [Homalodisca vitripennis]